MFSLPILPYKSDALAPIMSAETLQYHYGKHYQAYIDTVNTLIVGSEYSECSLLEITQKAPAGKLYNNSAQALNHEIFFLSFLSEQEASHTCPSVPLLAGLEKTWGGLEEFKKVFVLEATSLFGSGWTWLVVKKDGSLAIENFLNAQTPLGTEDVPLIGCDVWEHAYYIDYRNARQKYVENFFKILNWERVNDRFPG